jgi:hypothetical protein
MSDPKEILGALREVLLENMNEADGFQPWCSVQRALYLGQSGRILAEEEFCDDDTPIGLLLTMGDGSEIRLTVSHGVRDQTL